MKTSIMSNQCHSSVHNTLISKADVKRILSPYIPDIVINDISHYQQALVHLSFVEHQCNVGHFRSKESYDVLEFRGDSILSHVITEYLCERFPHATVDRLSQLRIGLTRGETLALLGKRLGLGRYVLVAQGIDDASQEDCRVGRQSDDVLEDAFEAFLAALMVDQGGKIKGMSAVFSFMDALLEKTLNFEKLLQDDQNPKGTLFSFCIGRKWNTPNLISLICKSSSSTGSKGCAYAVIMKKNQVEKWLDPLAQSLLEDKVVQEYEPLTSDVMDPTEEIIVSLGICHQLHRKKMAMTEAYTFAMQRFSNAMSSQHL